MASQEAVVAAMVTPFKYSNRVVLRTILGRGDGGLGLLGMRVVVGGWVRSAKEVKKEPDVGSSPSLPRDVSCVEILQTRIPFLRSLINVLGGGHSYPPPREKTDIVIPKLPSTVFLQISDGSCVASLKVVVESTIASPGQIMPTGTCILAEGVLKLPPVEGKHAIELQAEKILHIGTVDREKYPLSKKRLPIDSLRDFSHFKPRTTTVASVMRMRDALTHATHNFFRNNEFLYVQVPIITTTDAEGFSERFIVTTLLGKSAEKVEPKSVHEIEGVSLEALKAAIKEKSNLVEELKRSDSNKEALVAALWDLRKTNELAQQLESREKLHPGASLNKADEINFSKDFFSRETYLTVSGRLHLQSYACSLGNVYSFGPRFRAESMKHVAEMWMVELEMAFSQLEDAMTCAEDFLKFLCKSVLENCVGEINFFSKRFDKTNVDRLQSIISSSFERISYTQAVDALKQVTDNKFETKVEWGLSLTEEHETYLVGEIYKRPVIIFNYPKKIKPFYMRVNDDGETVAAFDVVVPKAGTLIRGSQNEERMNMLSTRIKELGIRSEEYEWYMDLRRHGTVKNSGFSVAFEHVVLFATGLVNVADVIPFPRSYGKANN
ncbi:hypothetical protein VitviT2T_010441 [Vitis vinifera]|uniref:asparagine--tRNA ligase n=4 Tax=Vitis vinifera TaxID=29760 RepID=A0ABY9CA76_VITVI|nr:asparagine--tRNA ligase, cytoplasmic 2 [Vitis vinifera]RVW34389.1 Asparagine--tRNA ligase, cytoplasmic 2 [Vitis vinifera]WJZ91361.1 hypothetical protein VitviT2T_010441 [Vitis vinifera]